MTSPDTQPSRPADPGPDFAFPELDPTPTDEAYRVGEGPTAGDAPEAVEPGPAGQGSQRKLWIVLGAVLAVFLLSVGAAVWSGGTSTSRSATAPASAAPPTTASESPFLAARRSCAPSSLHAKTGDGGRSLTIQSVGKKSAGLTLTELACFLVAVKTPDSVIAEMNSTRALDGRQTGEWDNIHASWTYHPDDGLEVIMRLV